jgi:hypothetical protein
MRVLDRVVMTRGVGKPNKLLAMNLPISDARAGSMVRAAVWQRC